MPLPKELLSLLCYPDYWNREPNLWGDVIDWDIYFIKKMPSCTARMAHSTLSSELRILLNKVPIGSRKHQMALSLRAGLKCNNAKATELWRQHSQNLGTMAINSRISKEKFKSVATQSAAEEYSIQTYNEIEAKSFSNDDNGHDITNDPQIVQQTEEFSEEEWEEESQEEYTDEEISEYIDNENLEQEEIKKRREEKEVKESNGNMNVRELLQQFSMTYKSLKKEGKWMLKSGRKVEDIIYIYGSKLKHEDLVHSFVINIDDQKLRCLFSEDEWNEIAITNTESKASPKIEENLLKYLVRYRKTTVQDLREVTSKSCTPEGCDFNTDNWFDYTWINNCISNLLTLYAVNPGVFQIPHLERWYDVNIWSYIIDQCIWNLKDLQLIRGESFSIASADRKSKYRGLNERKPLGHRCDGIFRIETSHQECGAAEHGRLLQGKTGTKFLLDSRKLAKVMKDMFTKLSVELCTKTMEQIEIVGYLHSGKTMQIFVMDYPCGYVVRLCKGEILEVPEKLDQIDNLLRLMTAVLYSKSRIIRTIQLLRTPDQTEEKSNESFIEELMSTSRVNHSNSENIKRYLQVPDTAKTPKKKKRKTNLSSYATRSSPPKFLI